MDEPLIGVVGPCAAGKTTLVSRLEKEGYWVRHIAQEHSYVPYMWQRITAPQILVYLHVSYPLTLVRRKMNWTEKEYEIQLRRLTHAREHAHIEIDTDALSVDQVHQLVIEFIEKIQGSLSSNWTIQVITCIIAVWSASLRLVFVWMWRSRLECQNAQVIISS